MFNIYKLELYGTLEASVKPQQILLSFCQNSGPCSRCVFAAIGHYLLVSGCVGSTLLLQLTQPFNSCLAAHTTIATLSSQLAWRIADAPLTISPATTLLTNTMIVLLPPHISAVLEISPPLCLWAPQAALSAACSHHSNWHPPNPNHTCTPIPTLISVPYPYLLTTSPLWWWLLLLYSASSINRSTFASIHLKPRYLYGYQLE